MHVCVQLCKIVPGQVVNRKLDETQTANMVRAAARPADERKARIMDAVSCNVYSIFVSALTFVPTSEEKRR